IRANFALWRHSGESLLARSPTIVGTPSVPIASIAANACATSSESELSIAPIHSVSIRPSYVGYNGRMNRQTARPTTTDPAIKPATDCRLLIILRAPLRRTLNIGYPNLFTGCERALRKTRDADGE